MSKLETLQADLRSLSETIDREASLEEIRIVTLRALTRHRFFSEEVLRATGDWEPRLAMEVWQRTHDEIRQRESAAILALSKEPDGIRKIGNFLRTKIPALPEEIRERAGQPLGQFLKHIVHRIAAVCVRDRDEEAAELWQDHASGFETEESRKEKAERFIESIAPERRERMMRIMQRLLHERLEKAEPGDDWVDKEDIVSSDEAFEDHRRRRLRIDHHELELYLLILDRRLKTGGAYSGLEMISEQETMAWPQEKPDSEPDAERDAMIMKLEELTGVSFK